MSSEHPSRRRVHGWKISLEASGVGDTDLEERVTELGDLLQPYGGAVAFKPHEPQYGAEFSIGQPDLDAASALSFGTELFRDCAASAGLPGWPIVHAEVTRVSQDHSHLRVVR
jgi:hypothetical protein